MDNALLPFRLRTARQKKRLQKADFDKQLIQLDRLRDDLWRKRRALPLIPLKEPYQKGWKRTFIVREDVRGSAQAAFYETLLTKINTVEYSADKAFRVKKRRKSRRIYVIRKQELLAIPEWEWNHSKLRLTDNERAHFHRTERWNKWKDGYSIYYVFTEPWRYVLQIRPHMITHVKQVDNLLEQQLSELDNQIERRHLRPRMDWLTSSHPNWWNRYAAEKVNYRNPLKNTPLHVLLSACSEEQPTL